MKCKVYVKVKVGDLVKATPFEFVDSSLVSKVEDVIYRGRYQYVSIIIFDTKAAPIDVLLHDICNIREIL